MEAKIQNVNLTGDTLTILSGKAPEPFNPKPISVKGDIMAIRSFVESRKPQASKTRCEYSFSPPFVRVITNEGKMDEYSVTGQLELAEDYKLIMGVHSDPTALGELLRKKRRYFTDPVDGSKLITALKGFKAKVDKEVENSVDKRAGAYKNAVERMVSSNLPETVKMQMEIVKGVAPVEFMVDIYVDVRDNGISIQLESIEAEEYTVKIVEHEIETVINEVIKPQNYFTIQV